MNAMIPIAEQHRTPLESESPLRFFMSQTPLRPLRPQDAQNALGLRHEQCYSWKCCEMLSDFSPPPGGGGGGGGGGVSGRGRQSDL